MNPPTARPSSSCARPPGPSPAPRRWPGPGHALTLIALTGLAAAALAHDARAEDTRVSVTNTLFVESRGENQDGIADNDDFELILDRLNVLVSAGDLVGQLRVDGFYFFDPPSDAFRDDLLLERVSVAYEGDDWSFTGGDFYRQLGRGILLSARKVDESAIDFTLRGGQLAYDTRLGGVSLDASLFAGRVNPANLDNINYKVLSDTNDVIVGASAEVKPARWIKTELMGMYLRRDEQVLDDHLQSASAGVAVELTQLFKRLSIYLEADIQQRELLDTTFEGYAAYGTADLNLGVFSLLFEGIYMDDFEVQGSQNEALGNAFRYNLPPTLERFDQQIVEFTDYLGGRLGARYNLRAWLTTLYANLSYRANGFKEEAPIETLHAYGGNQTYLQERRSRLNLSGGYRHELQRGETLITMVHGEIDYLQWITGRHAVHLQGLHETRTLSCGAGDAEGDGCDRYQRGSFLLSYEVQRLGALTVEYGYDTQNQSAGVRNDFIAGILVWEIIDELRFNLTVGTRRGGIRCIAGVCRNYPNFSGVQGTLVARF